MKNKKAQVGMYISFIIIGTIIILIASFAAPMMVRFNSEMYLAGEKIMLDANETLSEIQNDTVRTRVSNIMQGGLDATENNIEVGTALFRYGWVLIIGLTALILFIYTRRAVEYTQGGLV